MQCFFWEHFERAVWHFSVGVIGVLFASVGFGEVRQDNLHVAFRTERAAFQKCHLILYTTTVHVSPCLHVVQSISDYCQSLEELVAEDVLGGFANLVQSGLYVSFETGVHLSYCCCGGGAFWFSKVFLSEKELSVEIGGLDVVGVCDHDAALLPTADL